MCDFVIESFKPAYLDAAVRASLGRRVALARQELAHCRACPRACGVNRAGGAVGNAGEYSPAHHAAHPDATNDAASRGHERRTPFCGIGRHARVASAGPHFGEEDCLRGSRGSGTIFFAKCNLRCVFCQNWDISQRAAGAELGPEGIAEMMLDLQEQRCHNINLVTPEHVVPQVVEALAVAVDRGLKLPIVYNTSAYDSVGSLRLMDGLVDIYMPDFKLWSPQAGRRLCKAHDYPQRAREAIREMHRQVGDLRFTPDGVACRGLLVRHLVMPGLVEDSAAIFRWLAEELSPDTHVNIMVQYHPDYQVGRAATEGGGGGGDEYPEINRPPKRVEIEEAYRAARAAGLWRFDERRF